MKKISLLIAALILVVNAPLTCAQTSVKRFGSDKSIIASAIWAGDTLYVSGQLPAATPADPAKGTSR